MSRMSEDTRVRAAWNSSLEVEPPPRQACIRSVSSMPRLSNGTPGPVRRSAATPQAAGALLGSGMATSGSGSRPHRRKALAKSTWSPAALPASPSHLAAFTLDKTMSGTCFRQHSTSCGNSSPRPWSSKTFRDFYGPRSCRTSSTSSTAPPARDQAAAGRALARSRGAAHTKTAGYAVVALQGNGACRAQRGRFRCAASATASVRGGDPFGSRARLGVGQAPEEPQRSRFAL